MTGPTKRAGAPPTSEPRPGQKTTLSVRASPQLKAKILDAMKMSGRSLSEEAELRLDWSFAAEEEWGSAEIRRMAFILAGAFDQWGRAAAIMNGHPDWTPAQWVADPDCYGAASRAVVETLYSNLPTNDPDLRRQFLANLIVRIESIRQNEDGARHGTAGFIERIEPAKAPKVER
ncbi:hypothetical protein EDC65_0324 [Stella humosa]|uniref:Uncharacterized protein n=1 Tax=Stella humosa TaxID=94 RepID=A0A3N1MEM7_9PROT|nr:hypothetical protein EDC65_0324 [Stella humosa]